MQINFSGYLWRSGQIWGDFHPNNPTWWYDPECVDVTDGVLRLQTKYHRRENNGVVNTLGVGLISSIDSFGYGTFSADIMLPKGTGLFPAFWLSATNSWPPEIDIFEAWSRKSGLYTSNYIPYYSLASNVHYGNNDNNHKMIKSKSHMLWKCLDDKWTNFKLEWFPDRISIFYDGKLVREVKDQSILKWFENIQMQVIINNGLEKLEDYTNDSVMLTKNFKYIKY